MMQLPRQKTIVIGVTVAAIVVLIFFGISARRAHGVPESFTNARAEAAKAAQDISDRSKQVRDDLNRVQELEDKGQLVAAQPVLEKVQTTNETIKNDTATLSDQLTIMAQAVADIGDRDAQPLALEALRTDLSIVAAVAKYNTYLEELATLLEDRFKGKKVNEKRIDELVKHINDEVDSINTQNATATDQFKRFDEAIRAAK